MSFEGMKTHLSNDAYFGRPYNVKREEIKKPIRVADTTEQPGLTKFYLNQIQHQAKMVNFLQLRHRKKCGNIG